MTADQVTIRVLNGPDVDVPPAGAPPEDAGAVFDGIERRNQLAQLLPAKLARGLARFVTNGQMDVSQAPFGQS